MRPGPYTIEMGVRLWPNPLCAALLYPACCSLWKAGKVLFAGLRLMDPLRWFHIDPRDYDLTLDLREHMYNKYAMCLWLQAPIASEGWAHNPHLSTDLGCRGRIRAGARHVKRSLPRKECLPGYHGRCVPPCAGTGSCAL